MARTGSLESRRPGCPWHPANALEQSEAVRQRSRVRGDPASHPARWNLAYVDVH